MTHSEEKAYWEWRDTQGIMTKSDLTFSSSAHAHGFEAGRLSMLEETIARDTERLKALKEAE